MYIFKKPAELTWSKFGHGAEEVVVEDWCGIADGLPANGRRCRG